MYALVIPPELVQRLYRLREQHARGPIRRQILNAVEHYLDEVEQELGNESPPAKAADPIPETPTYPVRTHPRSGAQS